MRYDSAVNQEVHMNSLHTETHSPIYWQKFRALQRKAADDGLFCPLCRERRTLGKDVTPDVRQGLYRCKTCKKPCQFKRPE